MADPDRVLLFARYRAAARAVNSVESCVPVRRIKPL
jgi:hypothetical protein